MTHPLRDLIFSLFGRHMQRCAAVAVLAVGRRPGIQKASQGAGTATGGSGVEGTALVAVHILAYNKHMIRKSRECVNDVQTSTLDIDLTIIDPTHPTH